MKNKSFNWVLSISSQTLTNKAKFEGKWHWWDERINLGSLDANSTNSVLTVKINIVLEININISSSADRREGTGDLKIFQSFTNKSYFSF